MTELDVIMHMGKAGDFAGALAYDGPSGRYLLDDGECYCIEVDRLIYYSLYEKGLIYSSQVIQGGSAELFDLTEKGKEYYEENI